MSTRKRIERITDPFSEEFDPGAFSLDGLGESDEADAGDDPLAAVEYTGNEETDTKAEVSALIQSFRDRKKQEAERFRLATDSEYWVAVCFQSREQKEAFLSALKLLRDGDKYVDGVAMARALSIELPPAPMKFNISEKIDRRLAELAMPLPGIRS